MKNKYNEVEVKDNMKVRAASEVDVQVPEKKEMKQLVTTAPKKRKRSLLGRLVTGVLGPEGASGIGQYVTEEIIFPAVRNIIYSAIESTARMAIFGEKSGPSVGPRSGHSRNHPGYAPRTNYANISNNRSQEHERKAAPRSARYVVEEYIIEERYDAAHVVTTLTENADQYGSVSVADYYDLIGIPSQYTDNSYGWTIDSIHRATIVPVRGGYVIKFPPVEVV